MQWRLTKSALPISAVLILALLAKGNSITYQPKVAPTATDIDLTGYILTFEDEFNSLSLTTVSPKGSSTWYGLPPNGPRGYFSASQWDATSFSATGGVLSDTAWLDSSNQWHSGFMASIDTTGAGFSQLYGYFEVRAQMPNSGNGAWPSFWLTGAASIGSVAQKNEEIDVFEWYGVAHDNSPGLISEASHDYNSDGTQSGGLYQPQTQMPDGSQPWAAFHNYGVQIDPLHITWYIDGVQTNQIATPTSYLVSPFYMMVDYALGGGWPLSGMVNNSSFNMDWVRVYALPVNSSPTPAPTANSQSVTAPFNTSVPIVLTGTDPSNLPITYSVVAGPFHGTLTGNAPQLTYTPSTGYSGADSFTFLVNNGVLNSTHAVVSITVNAALSNPPPPALPAAPTITTQPQNQIVTVGQTATFNVTVTGSAPWTYQWTKNGLTIAGAAASNYTTPVVLSNDTGAVFAVLVSNAGGNTRSANATLTVITVTIPPGTLVPANLSEFRVYPNPWRRDKHAALPITFDHLTGASTIKIFTVSGHHVKNLEGSGSVTWDLTNDGGNTVASGIYLYVVKDNHGNTRREKLAIIR